jgi:hypothetical protein
MQESGTGMLLRPVHDTATQAGIRSLDLLAAPGNPPDDLPMQRHLIIAGIVLVIAGLTWKWLVRLPIGRLPGDFLIERPGVRVYLPITSMLLASALLTLISSWLRK